MSDWRAELERVKAAFAKGLGATEVLIDRATDDISAQGAKVDALSDRMTKLESEMPQGLREKLAKYDVMVEQLEEAKKEHTGKIRTIQDEALKETAAIEREKTRTASAIEKMKANKGVVVAVIAAAGSLLAQLAQLAWSAFGGG